jgi:DNA-binding MarR family transcriptional regulator
MVRVLFVHGNLNTRELSEKAGVPTGSRSYHLGRLEDANLVEQVGEEKTETGQMAPVWALTDSGEAVGEDVDSRAVSEQDVDELRAEIADLQDDLDTLEDELETERQKRETLYDLVELLIQGQSPEVQKKAQEIVDESASSL